jgi:DNA-binding LacI/PurR family transcriptional regulator
MIVLRRPTLEDVARLAGVSRAQVSLVVRGSERVSDASRERVLAACREVGYRPNLHARTLAQTESHIVGALVSDLHNPFFAEVVDGLHEGVRPAGKQLVMASGGRSPDVEREALEMLLSLQPAGVVLLGSVMADDDLDDLLGRGLPTPVVSVTRVLGSPLVDIVTIDEGAGADLAVGHLASLGHRRIAHVDGAGGAGAHQRAAGFRAAVERRGLGSGALVVPGGFTEASGADGADELLRRCGDDLPTAVFVANDIAAVGVLSRLAEAGVDVPGRVSVVGFDDSWVAGSRFTALTTVRQPKAEMGRLAVQAVLERAGGRREPSRVVVRPELVVRSTTGPAAPAAGGTSGR